VNTQVSAILRTKDIAQALNVSKPTACKLLHSGKIPKIQITTKCIGAFKTDVDALAPRIVTIARGFMANGY
jgi:excisionase family DNA binding protein